MGAAFTARGMNQGMFLTLDEDDAALYRGEAADLVEGTDYGEGTNRPFGLTSAQMMLAFGDCKKWKVNGTETGNRPSATSDTPTDVGEFIRVPPSFSWNSDDGDVPSITVNGSPGYAFVKDGLWWPAVAIGCNDYITIKLTTDYIDAGTKASFFGSAKVAFFRSSASDPDPEVVDVTVGPGTLL